MRPWKEVLAYLTWIGLVWSSLTAHALPLGAQQSTASGAESKLTTQSVASQQQPNLAELPDSPGAIRHQLQTEGQQSSRETSSAPQAPAEPQTVKPQEPAQSQTSEPSSQRPVGTAAAGPFKVSGVAASQPSGVAMAPGKQRRTRTIVLRVGAIVGAGVAVGTVVALTKGTPSKPPGAR